MDRHLNRLGLAGYALIGTGAVLTPSVMPALTRDYSAAGLTVAAIGLIFPALSLGSMVGNLAAGVGSDRLGRLRLVWAAALTLAVALVLAALARPWALFLGGMVAVAAGQGALGTGINALVADANPEARGRALNTLHAVYGAGAAFSPLVIGYLLQQGVGWRWALAGTGTIWLLYGLVATQVQPERPLPVPQTGAPALDLGMLRSGAFLALFVVAFVYNGVAYSLLGWVAVFMQKVAGLSTFGAVALITVFYVALTLGRVACAAYAERLGYGRTLLLLAGGIALTYPLVLLEQFPAAVVAGVFCAGLSLSGLFPTALAYGARLYPAQTGAMTGTLNIAMTLGAMIPPLWTGVIAAQVGLQVALGVNYLLVLLLLMAARYLTRQQTNPPLSQPHLG